MAQPCVVVGRNLQLGQLRDTADIDTWLLDHFYLEPQLIDDGDENPSASSIALAAAVARRALAFCGFLLRAAGVPSLDPGRVLRLEAVENEPRTFSVVVALPTIDNLDQAMAAKLFGDVMQTLLLPMASPPNPESVRALQNAIDRTIVAYLRRALPLGSSALHVCRLAFQHDIPFRHLGSGLIRLGWASKSKLFHLSAIEDDSYVGGTVAANKEVAARLLALSGLPVPEHIAVNAREKALAAARALGWPVVVKPADRARSLGVTVNIGEEAELLAAFDRARALSDDILIERHIPGICHRIMVANGAVVYVVRRRPTSATGNGASTVRELIAARDANMEKMPPWRRLVTVPADDLSARRLAEAGLTLDSVLAEGQVAELRPFTSDEWGGTLEDVLGDIHPDNEKLAIEAARALGLNFAGVDLITRDIATAWYDNGATINEVNARPQFSTLFREVRAPALLGGLVEGDGRIPVHLVSGRGDLVEVASRLRDRLRDRGRRCHLTTSHRTEDEDGREIVFGSSSLFERSLILAMRKDVSEIVMIGRRDELFERGLAVDVVENAFVVDDDASAADRLLGEIASRVRVKHAQAVRRGADLRLGPR